MIDFIIHNAKLLDVVAGERRPGASVRVERGRIVELAEAGKALSARGGGAGVDGGGGGRPGASIRVESGRIVELAEDGKALSAGEGVAVFDAGGRTLMPGLIDAH